MCLTPIDLRIQFKFDTGENPRNYIDNFKNYSYVQGNFKNNYLMWLENKVGNLKRLFKKDFGCYRNQLYISYLEEKYLSKINVS